MDRGYPLARKEGPVVEIYRAKKGQVNDWLTVTRSNSLSFPPLNIRADHLGEIKRPLEDLMVLTVGPPKRRSPASLAADTVSASPSADMPPCQDCAGQNPARWWLDGADGFTPP
jgi:hypothetical protein